MLKAKPPWFLLYYYYYIHRGSKPPSIFFTYKRSLRKLKTRILLEKKHCILKLFLIQTNATLHLVVNGT